MSSLFDSTPKVLGATPTVLHEVTVEGVGMSHVLSNREISTLPVWVWLTREGAPDAYLLAGYRLASGETVDALGTKKVALQVGDKIMGRCPRAGMITSVLSAYKDTPEEENG